MYFFYFKLKTFVISKNKIICATFSLSGLIEQVGSVKDRQRMKTLFGAPIRLTAPHRTAQPM